MTKVLPGLTLLTLSLFSGYSAAEGNNDAAVQQLLKQQTELNTRLSILLDQQGHTAKQLNELKNLQQQLSKQLTPQSQPPVYKKSSKKDTSDLCIPAEPGKTTPDGKMILGETEWIYVEEANGNFMSRIDTGATTSSISAHDVTVFEREGRRWVKFIMPIDGGKEVNVEAPFVKYIRIRQANGLEDRPIVRMTIRIGTVTEKADFSLTDRSNMDFPVLMGREFIKDVAVVDVARENVQGKPQIAGAVQASVQKKANKTDSTTDSSKPKTATETVKEGDKVIVVKKVPIKDETKPAVQPTADIEKPVKKPVKTAIPADAQPVKVAPAASEATSTDNKDKK
ncbi:RimK/LysX family protein [uncultured Tolumonas sp.]|uniref:ATP-dependent zinc protease family protein n=1 Tax=uncultured Tolumonas sp. TaxID=263765 RepID=UPI002A0A8D02|nr:RimK/LysX family protein [uncultured Tolumonas sp.]